MGRRSNFKRVHRDYYRTWDTRAMSGLAPLLPSGTRFVEPCAGAADLIAQLEGIGHFCAAAFDVEPNSPRVVRDDIFNVRDLAGDCFITNPPWSRKLLHSIILHLSALGPTWLLFDAPWAFTKQSAPYMPFCRLIVPIGRLKWFKGSKYDAKDDCAWYLFDQQAAARAPMLGPIIVSRNYMSQGSAANIVAFAQGHLGNASYRAAA